MHMHKSPIVSVEKQSRVSEMVSKASTAPGTEESCPLFSQDGQRSLNTHGAVGDFFASAELCIVEASGNFACYVSPGCRHVKTLLN